MLTHDMLALIVSVVSGIHCLSLFYILVNFCSKSTLKSYLLCKIQAPDLKTTKELMNAKKRDLRFKPFVKVSQMSPHIMLLTYDNKINV